MRKILYLIMLLIMLIVVSGCNTDNGIKLLYENPEIEMYVGETINVKPTILGEVEDGNYTLNYELSDIMAEIDDEGNLTALESGFIVVLVTINIDENAFASLTINIKDIEEGKYIINFDVNGGEKLDKETIIFSKDEKIELPIPVREGYIFLGWYIDDTLIETIKNRNYDLVAKWEYIPNKYTISYNIDNGVYLSKYNTRSELINDLILDIQSIKGEKYDLEYFMNVEDTGFGIFASTKNGKTFFSDSSMFLKWGWLIKYAKEVRILEDLDVSQYDNMLINRYVNTQAATINIELIAFISGRKINFTAGDVAFESSDYRIQETANGFWGMLHNSYMENNSFIKDTMLLSAIPNAVKVGGVFEGWYSSSDLNESSRITSTTKIDDDIILYPKFSAVSSTTNVKFDYNGGLTEELLNLYGNTISSLKISNFNGGEGFFSGYNNNIYMDSKSTDPKAQFSTRIYIAKDEYTNLYKIISILKSGSVSSWPKNAEYVVTISGQYSGTYDDNFNLANVKVGNNVIFDKEFSSASSLSLITMSICDSSVSNDILDKSVNDNFVMPIPIKLGYSFEGWYDDFGNKYESAMDFKGMNKINLYAIWKFKGQIIGAFDDKSWVVSGNTIQLSTTYIGENDINLKWTSENPSIAAVDSAGTVKGISEGLALIVVSDSTFPDVKFEFYVTVFNEDPSGILKLIVDSNNANVYSRNNLIIGIATEPGYYYGDVVGSVSKLLFEDYTVHNDYYLSNPNNATTLNGLGKNGIDFITVHYAADMTGSSTNGGKNLAAYNKTCNTNGISASWHYSIGPDGIWASQNEAWGAWHAGASKRFSWNDSGVTYKSTDPEFAKITLGNDGYFYINGQKTIIKNTTSGKKLNNMGLAFKVENGKYYLGGHYYNESYRYISSAGGNNNSIGMETSCAEGSDLWLTWQYTAQLCANLLLKYELPITQLVGHHFFSGKWCPQPMLEFDLEIWWEFVELVRQQMLYYDNYSNYVLDFSTESSYLRDNGRVSTLPTYSECAIYTVSYFDGTTTKTVTLSSLIPGTIA